MRSTLKLATNVAKTLEANGALAADGMEMEMQFKAGRHA